MRFVDTNILLYAISGDHREREKARVANEIFKSRDLALSTQVLQEFYVQATRPSRDYPLTHRQAADLLHSFTRFAVQPITLGLMQAALNTCERFGIAYWDAAIIEAARTLNCEQVLSEDLQHGQDYAGVLVVDPFV